MKTITIAGKVMEVIPEAHWDDEQEEQGEDCPACGGTGEPQAGYFRCHICKGSGKEGGSE